MSRAEVGRQRSMAATRRRWTGNMRAVGQPKRPARQRVRAENSLEPCMDGRKPAVRWRFWMAARMAVMADRDVPMHSSSQVGRGCMSERGL